jgi:hypothetical protein
VSLLFLSDTPLDKTYGGFALCYDFLVSLQQKDAFLCVSYHYAVCNVFAGSNLKRELVLRNDLFTSVAFLPSFPVSPTETGKRNGELWIDGRVRIIDDWID